MYFFLFLIFLFWIIIYFLNCFNNLFFNYIYLLWHFGSFNIWICVRFCNIWTYLADFNDYTMYYSFEDNQFFFYISLLCNYLHFVLFQKFIGSKSYDSLIFFGLSKVLTFEFESSNSVKYTMNVSTPKSKITNSSYMTNTKCVENEHKL